MPASNMMVVVGTVRATGFSQCYTCGFGESCAAGAVVNRHGFLEEIEEELLPRRLADQERAQFEASSVGKRLGYILCAQDE